MDGGKDTNHCEVLLFGDKGWEGRESPGEDVDP